MFHFFPSPPGERSTLAVQARDNQDARPSAACKCIGASNALESALALPVAPDALAATRVADSGPSRFLAPAKALRCERPYRPKQ